MWINDTEASRDDTYDTSPGSWCCTFTAVGVSIKHTAAAAAAAAAIARAAAAAAAA